MSDEHEKLTWSGFGDAIDGLARQVVASGFEPDLILSVARGGLALGMGLGYALDVKNLSAVNVEFYTGVDTRLPVPIMLPPTPDVVALDGLRILIADDIADTGLTLQHVQEFCADHVAEARIATVYEKARSVVKPDYCWKQTDAWIDFPWSSREPLVSRAR
ncbi:phosphoribosyltransferase [Nocardioides sp. R-C-SC26]|uniref:phosphoribosyltransferase n=1 Tax=Nocardioides sp. R-C-SC26 TaxID=2870414 RepID=UPI001E42E4A8|nr:phosphoribosyltransferase family protein [Nocardioides sp. R-C-SC26]